jgi:phosphoserine phosphatase
MTLDSWAAGATRSAIQDFVDRVTAADGPDYVPPAERVAVFDNDGTLWTEQPMVIQLDFTVRRLGELAEENPELRTQQPYQAAHEQDVHWFGAAMVKHYRGDDSDLGLLLKAVPRAFDQVSVEEYDQRVRDFFDSARNPASQRRYWSSGYRPMVELLRYLEANDFVTYIASGGDRDFMRPVADHLYGVPPERVIGSAVGLGYTDGDQGGTLVYKSSMDFFDDGPEKPVRIWSRIGRRPILAVGNSNGDIPMLKFAGGPGRPALRLLLHHDDAEREFAYDGGAEQALTLAGDLGWTVVSMRDDWTTVFADPEN